MSTPAILIAHRKRNRTCRYHARSQRGVALVISLVLLAAMTILGVATLSGTRLNEQIASNAQQKSIAFEAAESAIESASNYADLFGAITSDVGGTGNDPAAVPFSDADSMLKTGYDMRDDGINIEGRLEVQYCGEMQPVGTSLSAELGSGQMTAVLVDINSVVTVANSGASADHVRRVSFQLPQTGRTGNCTVRY